MIKIRRSLDHEHRQAVTWLPILAGLLIGAWPVDNATAQSPGGKYLPGPATPPSGSLPAPLGEEGVIQGPLTIQNPSMSGEDGPTPPLPVLAPRGPGSRQEVASFLDTLRANDAAFEVVVGQGRV